MADGAVKMPLPGLGFPGNPDVIKLFEQGLEMARRGEIAGIAMVYSAGPGHYGISVGGRHPLELHYGCGKLATALEGSIDKRPSPIVRLQG